jgi:hypothetical protein
MLGLIARNAKAIAAFVCSLVAMVWLRVSGHALDPVLEQSIEAFIIALIVWAIPNRGMG